MYRPIVTAKEADCDGQNTVFVVAILRNEFSRLARSMRGVLCWIFFSHGFQLAFTFVTGFEKTLRMGSARDSRNTRF